jgi:hypothetical protein
MVRMEWAMRCIAPFALSSSSTIDRFCRAFPDVGLKELLICDFHGVSKSELSLIYLCGSLQDFPGEIGENWDYHREMEVT